MQIAMFLIIFSVLMISGITGTPAVPTSTTDKSKDDFISNNVNPEIKEEDKPIEKPSEPEIIHHKPGIAVARIIDDIFQIKEMYYKILLLLSTFVITCTIPTGNFTVSSDLNLGQNGEFLRTKGRDEAFFDQPKPSLYEYAQQIYGNIAHPKPIIDTISEEEKYGNNGDQFRSIGNAIVNSYEGFSNFLNSAVDLPFEAMKKVTRKATSYLSAIGAKLVGL
ncbi:hypothetical protein FQR65_LT02867 [Abscondita terminalis]|nr:hypothetical protein FQR65_LT02867 [Abscondita terminalis]